MVASKIGIARTAAGGAIATDGSTMLSENILMARGAWRCSQPRFSTSSAPSAGAKNPSIVSQIVW